MVQIEGVLRANLHRFDGERSKIRPSCAKEVSQGVLKKRFLRRNKLSHLRKIKDLSFFVYTK